MMNENVPVFRAQGPLKIKSPEKRVKKKRKNFSKKTLHTTVVFTGNLIFLKHDYDRLFSWSVISSVCT